MFLHAIADEVHIANSQVCEALRTAVLSPATYYVLNMDNVVPLYLNVQNNLVTGLFATLSDFQNQTNNVILPPGSFRSNDNIFNFAAGPENLYGITLFGILGVQDKPSGTLGLIRAGVTSPLILETPSATGAFPSYFQQIYDVKVTPLLAPLCTFAPTKAPTHKPTSKLTAAPTHKHAAVPTCKHTATPSHKPVAAVPLCKHRVPLFSPLGVNITLCLSRDPAACTSTAQCPILGVYDASDVHFAHNWLASTTEYEISNNLYPLDALGVSYYDHSGGGPTHLFYYYSSIYLVNDYYTNKQFDRTPYSRSGACSVVGCDLQCDNGVTYNMSAASDAGKSGTGPQTVYSTLFFP